MSSRVAAALSAAAAVLIAVSMVAYPELAFQSALRGLRVWWFVVFPALLPFFVVGQLLMALGVVHFLGVLLERFMRPLFNVPGEGAFVVAMGLASGYPIGAVLTAKLLRQGVLNEAEAERLYSFCNTADPLFMGGAVAVGMFQSPAVAGVIMASHYAAALGTGLLLRFHRADEHTAHSAASPRDPVLLRAWRALLEARALDGRPFGQMLADSVLESIRTLMLVGGFIVLFAVVLAVLQQLGVWHWLSWPLVGLLRPLGLDAQAVHGLLNGLFEITIGTQQIAASRSPLLIRLVLVDMVIAWSGLSVLAQVAAVLQGTGVHLRPYILARVVQSLLAGLLTLWLWPGGARSRVAAVPTAAPFGELHTLSWHWSWLADMRWSVATLGLVLAVELVVAAVCASLPRVAVVSLRSR